MVKKREGSSRRACTAALLALALTVPGHASARAPRVIDNGDTVPLRGNVHPLARPEHDRGPTEPTLPMERMVFSLKRGAEKEAALQRLLAEQQDASSPNFHRWLTPEEFSTRFGADPEDIAALSGWLASQGFTVDGVSRGGTSVNFSGTAATVERAFHTRMRDYLVDGEVRHANAVDPSIPRALSDVVRGIVSLHNFPRKPMNNGRGTPVPELLDPAFTSGGKHYLSPADFATIYNVTPLYAAGIDGSGQSIAIVGRTHPPTSNWTTFRTKMGLPANAVQVIVNGADPGDLGAGEDGEADLDVEWSGAVAKNATIKFVTSKSTYATDGVDLSAQYIVDNNLAPVMSTSFGLCEAYMGSANNDFYSDLWQQAAAQGITSFVSSGDSGAAGCSSADASSGSYRAVNGLASTPYNVAVGGTQFSDGGGGYWSTSNIGYSSALGYIPESAWNESGTVSGGSALWSTGGGASSLYGKPSWQAGPGVPADGKRDIPDVSLTAATHDGYLVQTQGALYSMGGTSASSPAFAGLMALVVQKTGKRQGNANPRLYQLGSAQYGAAGPAVFHDTTAGNNTVPGVTGYPSGTGYDLSTGLGSVDAHALVTNWEVPPAALAISSSSIPNGTVGASYSTTVSGSGGTLPYTWSLGSGVLAQGLTLGASTGIISGTPTAAGVYSCTVTLTDSTGTSVAKAFSQAVSATPCANLPVLSGGASPAYYPDFLSAYPFAADGDLIKLQALPFGADFVLDREVAVAVAGGYDCAYGANAGSTTILGALRVKRGTVNLDGLRLK